MDKRMLNMNWTIGNAELGEPNSTPREPVKCSFCGGAVEEQPMVAGVCYDCYREQVILPDWQEEAEAAMADYLDLKETEETARY